MPKALENERFFGMEDVPFVDQLQGVNESLVEKEYGKISDAAACRRFGAPLLQFFTFWGWRACGIANVAMILQSEFGESPTLYELICEGLRLDGYAFRDRWGKTDIGWKHHTLCQLLEKRRLHAVETAPLNLKRVGELVRNGKYIIASVKSARGGHLILVTGFLQGPGVTTKVLVHDPYTFGGQGGPKIIWDGDEFRRNSLGRGIIVWAQTFHRSGKTGAFDCLRESSAGGTEKMEGS